MRNAIVRNHLKLPPARHMNTLLQMKQILYEARRETFQRTNWYCFHHKDPASRPMAYFVKTTDLDLVLSLCNKSCKDGLCDVACDIDFFVSLEIKASVFYTIAQ